MPSCRAEREPLRRVALAHHVRRPDGAEAVSDRAQPTARLHRRELPRVADRDDLRADRRGVPEQPLGLPRRRHPGLVEDHDAALGQPVSVGDREQSAVQGARRDRGLLGELARRAGGRRDADHRVTRVLVQLAQHAGRVRLAGPGERLDHIDAVARPSHGAHRRRLAAVQRARRPLERGDNRWLGQPRDALAGAPGRGRDQRPLALDEAGARQRAARRREDVIASDEPLAERPHRVDSRALRGRPGELAQHAPPVESVRQLSQPGWPRQRQSEVPLTHRLAGVLERPVGGNVSRRESLGAAGDDALDELSVEAVLGGTGRDSSRQVCVSMPYSESNFKTLKYRPEFPARFDTIEHARSHCRAFVDWYNHAHRHSGIGLMTPAAVHHGTAPALHAARAAVLDAAYAQHPERFVRKPPVPPELPTAAWINKPAETKEVAAH